MGSIGIFTNLVLVLFITCSLKGCESSSLNRYLHHYEHVHYDKDDLMYHHYRVQRSMTGPREIELKFKAFGKDFDLRLYPDDSHLHKNLRIFKDSEPYKQITSIKSVLYSGYDIDDPSIKVTGHLAFGTFDGSVYDGDEIYYIEPSTRYLSVEESTSHSIIYRHSDVNTTLVFTKGSTPCGATTLEQKEKLFSVQHEGEEGQDTGPFTYTKLNKRAVPKSRNTSLVRCTLKVIADYLLYNEISNSGESTGVRMAQTIALLRNFISTGSRIFELTNFDTTEGNTSPPDGIHFIVLEFRVNTTAPDSTSPYFSPFIGVESFLTRHSSNNWEDFCLSYLFTYRDFDGGVLGLAYVGSTNLNSQAGICARYITSTGRTQNTGIVTLINFGQRVPTATSALTFTHEAGHNFGSNHDPDTARCSPSSGGKYVMFASANDGSLPNNNQFSPCSRDMMNDVMNAKANICFLEEGDNCRNNLIDEGEECDCGRNYDINGVCNEDSCCNGTTCMLVTSRPNVVCSPQQGSCCADNCSFISQDIDFVCSSASECAFNQTCNGTSAACPTPEPVEPVNGTAIPCNGGSNFCVNGVCTGSICVPLGLRDCECSESSLKCHVCCNLNSVCISTQTIATDNTTARDLLPNGQGQFLQVGFPCDNFTGYCNFLNVCQPVESDNTIDRFRDLFRGATIQSVVNFFTNYWWSAIIGLVVIIVALFGIVFACHCLLPRPEHMKERGDRRATIRRTYSQRRSRRRVQHNDDSSYPMANYQYHQ